MRARRRYAIGAMRAVLSLGPLWNQTPLSPRYYAFGERSGAETDRLDGLALSK